MREQVGRARRAGAGWVRVAAVGAVTAVCLVAAPGPASAQPTDPGDAQIGAAQQAKDDAAREVDALSAQLVTAQAQVDAAHAASAIALDAFEGKQAEYEAARVSAESAAVAAQLADAAVSASRVELAAFARTSYIQGTTSPGVEAMLSADNPAQLLERAAMLGAAGKQQSDVLDQLRLAQHQATVADAAAKATFAQADALQQQAAAALTTAEQLETAARQQAAEFQARQTDMQYKLQQAQQKLLGLQGARAAAEQYARQQVAASAAAYRDQAEAVAARQIASRDSGSSPAVQTAINAAMQYIGTRYAWGGGSLTGPSAGFAIDDGVVGFDCSGLTRYAYAQAGIPIVRSSTQQYATLPKVSRDDLKAGDLVFWALDPSNPATIHHVALYLGNDLMLEAPQSGQFVHVTAMRFDGQYIGAVRPSA